MGLPQQWNWLLKFGCNAEETNETTQQILCSDSSAALGMIKRKGSTCKTRHIELKAFFWQQWSARPEVRIVQVVTSEVTSEMVADCLTRIQSTPNSVHLSRPIFEINPVLNRFEGRAEEGCRNSIRIFDSFWYYFSLAADGDIRRSAMNSKFPFAGICEASHEQTRTTSALLDAG